MAIEFCYECRFASKYIDCIESIGSQDIQVDLEHLLAVGVLLENGNFEDLEYYFMYIIPESLKTIVWEDRCSTKSKRVRFEAKRNNTYHKHLFDLISADYKSPQAKGRYIAEYIREKIDNAVTFLLKRQSKATESEDIQSNILEELKKTNQLLATLTVSGIELGSVLQHVTKETLGQNELDIDAEQQDETSKEDLDDPLSKIDTFDFETLNI